MRTKKRIFCKECNDLSEVIRSPGQSDRYVPSFDPKKRYTSDGRELETHIDIATSFECICGHDIVIPIGFYPKTNETNIVSFVEERTCVCGAGSKSQIEDDVEYVEGCKIYTLLCMKCGKKWKIKEKY